MKRVKQRPQEFTRTNHKVAFLASCWWACRYILFAVAFALFGLLLHGYIGSLSESRKVMLALGGSIASIYVVFVPLAWHKIRNRHAAKSLVLRGFAHERKTSTHERILPVIGCYSSVLALKDPRHKPIFDRWSPVKSDLLTNIERFDAADDSEWRDKVKELISEVDMVVIDITELTQNVLWEIDLAFEIFPLDNILIILEYRSDVEPFMYEVRGRFRNRISAENQLQSAIYSTELGWFLGTTTKSSRDHPFSFEHEVYRFMKKSSTLREHADF